MTHWHLGTMGYSYQDWVGVFYPEHLKPVQYLKHYSKFYNAVEIDSTFYGTPSPNKVIRWRNATPDEFVICPKFPKQITHENRLLNSKILTEKFCESLSHLNEKLGPILIQLPPNFSSNDFNSLENFLNELPEGPRYAVEFRNKTWNHKNTFQLLRDLNICWVSTDYIILPKKIFRTTDSIYVRWIGFHGQFTKKNRIQKDTTEILHNWKQKIYQELADIKDIYGFFNNDFAGHAPLSCNQFKKMVGLSAQYPVFPKQGTLFT